MANRFRLLAVVLIMLTLTAAGRKEQKPLNLIIFIGDGMGAGQVYAGMTVSGFTMTFPLFPVTGFCKTYSSNRYITDSAAAGTAISTGEKTNNGMIGVLPDGTEVPNIMELAKINGLSTGLISTSEITHATPASFIAHVDLRANYEDIAKWFMMRTVDVFIGGGDNHFTARKDSVDLASELEKMGYDIINTLDALKQTESNLIAGLMAEKAMPYIESGRDPDFLAEATIKAINVLSRNKKGFILMVEGSQIDWAGHDNNMKRIVDELLDLDRAVKVAYDYAREKGNTLIIVTADHETGGLTLTGGNIEQKTVTGSFSTKGHTADLVPVFSYGPGASAFSGVQDNTELFDDFVRLLSLKK